MFIDHNNFNAEALPKYSRAADVYEQMAAAFEKFEQMIEAIDTDNETGFAPYPGDVADGCKQYAEHLRTVCRYAAEGDVEFAAALDFEHGESIQQYLELGWILFIVAMTCIGEGQEGIFDGQQDEQEEGVAD